MAGLTSTVDDSCVPWLPGKGFAGVSRKGELWRGDLAQQIDLYLQGQIDQEALIDWAMDHPFFEDQTLLDSAEQRVIAHALGSILQMDDEEPRASRTSRQQLDALLDVLWGRAILPQEQ